MAVRTLFVLNLSIVIRDGTGCGCGKMTQNHQFAILYPLMVGIGGVACTIFVHAFALAATVTSFAMRGDSGEQAQAP